MMDRIIAMRRALGAPPAEARDLFDMLDMARDPETGAGFEHAELRDEIATMIIAGHETTSTALFWACYIAAKLPRAAGADRRGGAHGRSVPGRRRPEP